MTIAALKETRAATIDALRAIVAAAAAQARDLSEQEQAAFDSGKAEVEKLERDIRNTEFLAEAERRAHGEPVGNGGDKHFETECGVQHSQGHPGANAGLRHRSRA
jgi:hypothetical protein